MIIAPPSLPEGEAQTLTHLQPLWEELESLVQSQKIAAIGTSDLDKTLLEQLYNWAQVCNECVFCDKQCTMDLKSDFYFKFVLFHAMQIKPSSNQVNLASCCVMPPDLTAFAKEFDIQLLTHNDPKGVYFVLSH